MEMSALGPKGRSWAQVSFQERKGFEKVFTLQFLLQDVFSRSGCPGTVGE